MSGYERPINWNVSGKDAKDAEIERLRAEVEALKEESALWEERARHCGWRDEHAAIEKEKPK